MFQKFLTNWSKQCTMGQRKLEDPQKKYQTWIEIIVEAFWKDVLFPIIENLFISLLCTNKISPNVINCYAILWLITLSKTLGILLSDISNWWQMVYYNWFAYLPHRVDVSNYIHIIYTWVTKIAFYVTLYNCYNCEF